MPVSPNSLVSDRCYLTATGEVRRIVELKATTSSTRHRGVFPAWDKTRWQRTTKVAFASQASSEVPCG